MFFYSNSKHISYTATANKMVKQKKPALINKSNSHDITLVQEDNNKLQAHKVMLSAPNPKICKFHNSGYCKFKSTCINIHHLQICTQIKCINKLCENRHPIDCHCGVKCRRKMECKYVHNRNDLVMMKLANKDKEISELKVHIENLIQKKDTEINEININIKEVRQINEKLNKEKDNIIKENITLKNEIKD